ncbi:TetR/AcrR family transcriptional regulator [Desulfogranum japonicum]|uniref:TetR/AcrR family transcriptional regulator n=1 Tax=Desulfogranum japonicum TaxID=231447 RepID=UPI00040D4744|nr:TetR/AcrR family transcriptional regulator [Desulfogranum japonicum]
MTRRDDIKAETRELILQAAHSLFWEKGAEKCTIRGIAQEAGVSAATIIVHFKNKTALLEAVLSEDIEETLSGALGTLPRDAGLQATLLHIATAMVNFYDHNRELYRVLIRDTLFEPSHESPSISKMDSEYFPIVAAIIDREKAAGKIRKEVDSLLASQAFFSLYIGQIREFLRTPEMSVSTTLNHMSNILDLLFNGMYIQEDNS